MDRLVAHLRVRVDSDQPNGASDQPGDLEDDVDWARIGSRSRLGKNWIKRFQTLATPGRTKTTTLSRASERAGHRFARAGFKSSKSR